MLFCVIAPSHLRSRGHCPPGLEYLAQIDQLVIKQQIEIFERNSFTDICVQKLFLCLKQQFSVMYTR